MTYSQALAICSAPAIKAGSIDALIALFENITQAWGAFEKVNGPGSADRRFNKATGALAAGMTALREKGDDDEWESITITLPFNSDMD